MILTGQLKYLMSGLWNINELTSEHLICEQIGDEIRYIEIKKESYHIPYGFDNLFPYIVSVSIPLTYGRYMKTFPSEMMAYEYLENFVMEPIDMLEDTFNNIYAIKHKNTSKSNGFVTKKRRLSM